MTWTNSIGPSASAALQRPDVEPVGLERDRHQLGAQLLQQEQRPVVGRLLDRHPRPRLDQVREEHRPRLERPIGDHHLRRVDPPVPLGDPLAEPGMPDPDAIRQRRLPVVGKRPLGGLPNLIVGQDVGARRAPSERDRVWHGRPNLATSRTPASSANFVARGGEPSVLPSLGRRIWQQSSEARRGNGRSSTWRARQQGVLTRAQLASLGVGRRTIHRWLASGRLRAVHREVYAFGPAAAHQAREVARRGPRDGTRRVAQPRERSGALGTGRGPAPGPRQRPAGAAGPPRASSGIQVHRCKFDSAEVTIRDRHPGLDRRPHPLRPRRTLAAATSSKSAWDEADPRSSCFRLPEVAVVYERGAGDVAPAGRISPSSSPSSATSKTPPRRSEDRFAAFVVAHRLPPPQTNVLGRRRRGRRALARARA